MKKFVLSIFIIATCLFSVFAQNEASEISFSVLNEKYLINVSAFFSDASYQNPNGEKFKYAEVNKMLLSVPENKKVMKKYKAFTVATYALIGIACAGLATNVIYSFNEDLPHSETIVPIALYGTSFSVLGALVTSKIAGSTYKIAVDNYNLDLLGIDRKF